MTQIDMELPESCEECKDSFSNKGIYIRCGNLWFDCPLKEVPSGKWIFKKTENPNITVRIGKCSECGFTHDFLYDHTAQYRYCPSCGAKMEQTGEKEDV